MDTADNYNLKDPDPGPAARAAAAVALARQWALDTRAITVSQACDILSHKYFLDFTLFHNLMLLMFHNIATVHFT